MTHFTVGVIVPPGELPIDGYIDERMQPYREHSDADPYVCYSIEQAKAEITRDTKRLKRIIEREAPDYNLAEWRKILAELCRTTPEKKFAEYVRHHESFNDQGDPISTYNPDSKWDWYRIGGRWDGWIAGNQQPSDGGYNLGVKHESLANNMATTEQSIKRSIIPHAVVTPDGQWHERGEMGWFAVLRTENENWDAEARSIFARYPGHHVVILDAHI